LSKRVRCYTGPYEPARTIRIATWNIAGGRPVKSLESYDYHEEDLEYFADELAKVEADIVCLQEAHTQGRQAVAEKIAGRLGLAHVFNAPLSPSHIEEGWQLGLAMLCRQKSTRVCTA